MKKLIALVSVVLVGILATQLIRKNPDSKAESAQILRIVSLAPSFTEIVFELGAGSQLAGVTTYCTYPPEAQTKEKVGGFVHPNLEKIVSLEPDLVLAEHWTSSKAVPSLRRLGIKVLETPNPQSFGKIYGNIREVGRAIGKPSAAQALVESMKLQVEAIEEKGKRLAYSPTLYIEIDLPSWTVGRNSFINEAILLCGAQNVFSDIEMPALQVSKEAVIKRNPDVILSLEATAREIRSRPGWNQIRAVQHGNIIDNLDRNLLSHGNHRLLEGMRELQTRLSKIIH